MAKSSVKRDNHGFCLRANGEVFRPQIPTSFNEYNMVKVQQWMEADLVIVRPSGSKEFEVWISHGRFSGDTNKSWVPGERQVNINGISVSVGPCCGTNSETPDIRFSNRVLIEEGKRKHPESIRTGGTKKQVSRSKRTFAA